MHENDSLLFMKNFPHDFSARSFHKNCYVTNKFLEAFVITEPTSKP